MSRSTNVSHFPPALHEHRLLAKGGGQAFPQTCHQATLSRVGSDLRRGLGQEKGVNDPPPQTQQWGTRAGAPPDR